MGVRNFFTKEQQDQIVNAIKEAELNTSGEVRVHLDQNCEESVLDRAAFVFAKLKMHKTKLRNGVLFYLATKSRKFAIIGDAGINQQVPDDFWDSIKNHVLSKFKEGNYADGLSEGIIKAGNKLKEHFPYQADDINELSDDISFGNQ
jgi:uncharacterized membrane protein